MPDESSHDERPLLRREVGLFGATMMGLGSIVGTGVFVSLGIAAGVAGPAALLAIVVAAGVAACNGLSSAQLAASHPVSGGTYEYGYRWLQPWLGFTAGWMFLCAKTASAATAALGFAGYLLNAVAPEQAGWQAPLAVGVSLALTLLVLSGVKRSSRSNIVLVSITLGSLLTFVLAGLPAALKSGTANLTPFFAPGSEGATPLDGFLEACALIFVAYTGYGRIATLAEEVQQPRRTIPRAIIVTLLASMTLYLGVGLVSVAAVGAESFARAGAGQAAPLEAVARQFAVPGVALVVAVGAASAMLGVLLNLILGLSRVLLAMGRRGDMPECFARINGRTGTPTVAALVVGGLIAALAAVGDVKTTWSFSAFTALVYYAITNLAALRLSETERLYPRWLAWLGLASCLFLAFRVDRAIWLAGLGLIAAGLVWSWLARRLTRTT